jgi:hypothetical protein
MGYMGIKVNFELKLESNYLSKPYVYNNLLMP